MLTKIKPLAIHVILLIALFIRAYHLNSYPALNPDEAAIGYNAFSLIQTGLDEHGAAWPLHFKSFGDFKPGGYFYLTLPFIKLLGLTPLSVRLPNLILSLLTIFFLYKLILLLTRSDKLALLSSLVLTFNPWHIHFSRGAWESNAALAFITIGLYYFYLYLKTSKTRHFFFFTFLFIASLYTYHSARIIAPLVALGLIIINFGYFKSKLKYLIIPSIIGVILVIPVLWSFLHTGGATRFQGVGLTADPGPLWRANELLNHHGNTLLVNRIIHNQRLLYLLSWAQKYASHFNLNFLFLTGDEVPRSRVPDMGQFHLIDLPFIVSGLIFLLKSKTKKLSVKGGCASGVKSLIIILLLTAPLASSLTFQAPSALRSLPLTIPLSILVAVGIYHFLNRFSRIGPIALTLVYAISGLYYLDAYFVHYQKRHPFAWNYGFDQAIAYLNDHQSQYQHIYFTDKYDQPYILYLFYSRYNPSRLQPQIRLTSPDQYGFSTVTQIDNIHFGLVGWDQIPPRSLVIADDNPLPAFPVKVINFPNGQPAFTIYTK